MKSQNLEIQTPDGMEPVIDYQTGKITWKEKPKDVKERFKTIDDVLKAHNLTRKELDESFANVPEHLKNQYIAELLCESLNEGWEPDWADRFQYKYYPWFEMGGSSGFRYDVYGGWLSGSCVGSRLCLKSADLAKYAGQQFTDLYKSFMLIKP